MLLYMLQTPTSDPNSGTVATATVVIAIATATYVAATILLWWTTKQSLDITRRLFESTQRPYIGAKVAHRLDHASPERIEFGVAFTNAGTVSAHDVWGSLLIIIDGNLLPRENPTEEENLVLLPNQFMKRIATVYEPEDLTAVKGASTLALLFKCTYKGPTEKEYYYQQRYTYNQVSGHFATVRTDTT